MTSARLFAAALKSSTCSSSVRNAAARWVGDEGTPTGDRHGHDIHNCPRQRGDQEDETPPRRRGDNDPKPLAPARRRKKWHRQWTVPGRRREDETGPRQRGDASGAIRTRDRYFLPGSDAKRHESRARQSLVDDELNWAISRSRRIVAAPTQCVCRTLPGVASSMGLPSRSSFAETSARRGVTSCGNVGATVAARAEMIPAAADSRNCNCSRVLK